MHCNVCLNPEIFIDNYLNMANCGKCSYSFRIVQKLYDLITDPQPNDKLVDWLYKLYKPNTVLDIRSGDNKTAELFRNKNCNVYTIDYEPGLLGYHYQGDLLSYKSDNKYDLITIINTLEYLKDPLESLKLIKNNVDVENSIIFIKSLNKNYPGFKAHDNDNINNFFTNKSFEELFRNAGLYIVWSEHDINSGFSSFLLRFRKPKISLCMIVKNEENFIVDCLNTVKDFCDEIIVLDTGSSDNTKKLAESVGAKIYESKHFDKYTKIENFHFANARNEAFSYATGDWLFWMDADDRFIKLKEKFDVSHLNPNFDTYHVWIESGSLKFTHCRFFRNWGVRFEGACHEYPIIDGLRAYTLNNVKVNHITENKPSRGNRNLLILQNEFKVNPKNKRNLFYLANSYKDLGLNKDAIFYYNEYINTGGNFRDELFLAHYYMSICCFNLGKFSDCIKICFRTLMLQDTWSEPYCLIGESYIKLNDYKKAIHYLKLASELQIPNTNMFVRKELYNEIPLKLIKVCEDKLITK